METFGVDEQILTKIVPRRHYILASEPTIILHLYFPIDQNEQAAILKSVKFHTVKSIHVPSYQLAQLRFLPLTSHHLLNLRDLLIAHETGISYHIFSQAEPKALLT
jgi:hypothetical protein